MSECSALTKAEEQASRLMTAAMVARSAIERGDTTKAFEVLDKAIRRELGPDPSSATH